MFSKLIKTFDYSDKINYPFFRIVDFLKSVLWDTECVKMSIMNKLLCEGWL